MRNSISILSYLDSLQVLELLYGLLRACDPELAAVLASASLPPFFALSWLITWFAHDVYNAQVSRGRTGAGVEGGEETGARGAEARVAGGEGAGTGGTGVRVAGGEERGARGENAGADGKKRPVVQTGWLLATGAPTHALFQSPPHLFSPQVPPEILLTILLP